MFDPKTDPLGVGVQSRARENRFRLAAQGLSSPLGPLPDPQWDGFFQAVAESAPGKSISFREGPSFNEDGPQTQNTAVLDSLRRLRKPHTDYESYDVWKTKQPGMNKRLKELAIKDLE